MDIIAKLQQAKRRRKRALALKNQGIGVVEIARRLGVSKQLAAYYLRNGHAT